MTKLYKCIINTRTSTTNSFILISLNIIYYILLLVINVRTNINISLKQNFITFINYF